jgi:uncharacterized protein
MTMPHDSNRSQAAGPDLHADATPPTHPRALTAFSVMAKPIGPVCNLDCSYCYYVRKNELYDREDRAARMRDEVLDAYIRDYIHANPAETITFAWQGGEPTLLGLDYFKRVVALQKWYCPPDKRIENAFQTNGTLLDEEWCRFFHDERFLIGLSIDGPEAIHDGYRLDRGQKPTWAKVMTGLELLRRHRVEFNTLTTVHRNNQQSGRVVYDFLTKEVGSRHLQFIPIVERHLPDGSDAGAPVLGQYETRPVTVSPESVGPGGFGAFLCDIYDHWITRDVGRIYVYAFEQVLSRMVRGFSGICVHEETCGRAVVLERDGGLYSCDHFVYPEYRIGTLGEQGLAELMDSSRQRRFGTDKRDKLTRQCQLCPVRQFCHGGCPKHRFAVSSEGEPGLHYLCSSYFRFFTHVQPGMGEIADLIRAGREPALVMKTRR